MGAKKDSKKYKLLNAGEAWDLAESGIEGIQVLVDRTWSSPDVLAYRRKEMTSDHYVSINCRNTYRVEVE